MPDIQALLESARKLDARKRIVEERIAEVESEVNEVNSKLMERFGTTDVDEIKSTVEGEWNDLRAREEAITAILKELKI